MSQGVYGTKIPATINPSTDVDIYYSYRETLADDDLTNLTFKSLDSSNLLVSKVGNNVLEGMYNLKLPVNEFSKKGFYSVYIKPKEIECEITDVSVLVTYPDIKGIVININNITDDAIKSLLTTNNGLVGYRVIYFDNNIRQSECKIITSNGRCEPVVQNLTNSNQNSIRYRYNDNSDFVFITLTPSIAPSYNENMYQYIGKVGQKICIVNTLFEPILLDIEMVEHDAETISTMLEGSQLRNLDEGMITTFNEQGDIYHQSEHYTLKNNSGQPVYEVKKNKVGSIDFTQTITDK